MADSVSPLKAEETPAKGEVAETGDGAQEHTAAAISPEETPSKSTSPKPRVSFQDGHEEIPPTKPPRPVDPRAQAEHTLIEAFPSIDPKVIKAVLTASHGSVEPAFNALLGMSDPDFKPEEAPPPQPPRPTQRQPRNQLEADEMYARRLAEQYNSSGQHNYNQRERRGPNQQRQYDDNERSFFDDDLPEIGRNIQQGFAETQKKFNSWITTFKKKLDGEDEEDEDLYSGSGSSRPQGRQNFGSSQSEQMYGIRKSAEAQRRSTDAQRYDADPHEMNYDEFDRLELRDEEAPPRQPPRTSSRQPPNPDLFKPQPKPPQSGPVDEVDAAERRGEDPDKGRKWQPLTSVAPHPEDDNDPFSLGDDDEDTKDKTEDTRKEDTERLKKAARNSISVEPEKKMTEHERSDSGTKNKEAEELLAGKKDDDDDKKDHKKA